MKHINKALVLAPHTDDGELGCGATIAKLIAQGTQVYYAAFSTADQSVPDGFPADQLIIEVREATRLLGILPEHLKVYTFEVRKLNYVRQEILELLITLKKEIGPDMVFLPSSKDIHQDHLTVYHEGIRAFKFASILGYELIWNNLSFSTDCFVEVDEQAIETKINALGAYKTQEGKNYMAPDFIRSLARVRGTQIGVQYAEAFEVIRWIM